MYCFISFFEMKVFVLYYICVPWAVCSKRSLLSLAPLPSSF